MIEAINECANLEQLFDLLEDKGESIDERILASLPVYNVYHEPTDTQGIWSYDDQRAIVGQCVQNFKLVNYVTGERILDAINTAYPDAVYMDEGDEVGPPITIDLVHDYADALFGIYLDEKQAKALLSAFKEWLQLVRVGEATQAEWDRLCKKVNFTVFSD